MISPVRITLFLFFIVVLLGGFLVITDKKDQQNLTSPVSTIDASTIKHIRIEYPDKNTIEFQKKKDNWTMTVPYQVTANPTRVKVILKLLNTESLAQYDVARLDLKRLGLSNPKILLSLDNHEFAFGDTEIINGLRYIKFTDVVHLINDGLYQQLAQDAVFFIDMRLLPVTADLISIVYPDHSLSKQEKDWVVSPPMELSAATIHKIVTAWRNAEAITIRPLTESVDGNGIVIRTARGNEITFHVVSIKPGLILARKDLGLQYYLNGNMYGQLFLNDFTQTNNNVFQNKRREK